MKIRVVGFPFLAKPPEAWNTKYKGVIEFPGFHTTSSFDIAAAYALGKVKMEIVENEDGTMGVTDYPVVIALNVPETAIKDVDYDAVNFVMDTLVYQLGEIVENVEDLTDDTSIIDAAQHEIDMSTFENEENLEDPYDLISEYTFSHFQNPIEVIMDNPRFPEMVRDFAQTGQVPKDAAMYASQQFRYIEDIPENTIVAVWYLYPMAEEMTDYAMYENEEEGQVIDQKWPGFDVVDKDDAYVGYHSPTQTLVYGNPDEVPNLEYHGTTYLRLRNAAPELPLPDPPSPPFINS
jgi:hypothetical protein